MRDIKPYGLNHPHNDPDFRLPEVQHLFQRLEEPEKRCGRQGEVAIVVTDEDVKAFPQLHDVYAVRFCYMLGNAGGWNVTWDAPICEHNKWMAKTLAERQALAVKICDTEVLLAQLKREYDMKYQGMPYEIKKSKYEIANG